MKKLQHIFLLLACAALAMAAHGATFETLTFVKTDGTTVSFSVDGLKITYDDYAHAVITNNDTHATLDLADLKSMHFGEHSLAGDVNGDGEVGIADVNVIINVILGTATNPRADVNGDGEVTVADINTLINIIIGG